MAYCEQAVIFLKQAKLERDGGQRRKEEGTLPVSPEASVGMAESPQRVQTCDAWRSPAVTDVRGQSSVRLKEPVAHNKRGISAPQRMLEYQITCKSSLNVNYRSDAVAKSNSRP